MSALLCGCSGRQAAAQPDLPHYFSIPGFLTPAIKGQVHMVTDHLTPVYADPEGGWTKYPDSLATWTSIQFDREGMLIHQYTSATSEDESVMVTYVHEPDRTLLYFLDRDEPIILTFEDHPDMRITVTDYSYFKTRQKDYYENGMVTRVVSDAGPYGKETRTYTYDERGLVTELIALLHDSAIHRYEYLTFDERGNWTSRIEYLYRLTSTEPQRIRLQERRYQYYD